jgi:GntR family transcriptional regulator
MFIIDPLSATPVYEQLVNQVKRYVLVSLISEGEQLPSVRAMSLQLGINPNTVQKAYIELESMGITASVPGKGCFVTIGARQRLKNSCLGSDGSFGRLVNELKNSGFTEEELISAVKGIFEGRNQM